MGCIGSREDVKNSKKAGRSKESAQEGSGAQEHKQQENEGEAANVQAGGHVGTILFEGSRLLKRAKQSELDFWQWLFRAENTDPSMNELKSFLPAYYGIEQRDSVAYLSMENLLEGYEHANYMDCKLGKITWAPYKSEAKIASQVLRNKETTTGSLGFRVTGLVTKASSGELLEQWTKGPELLAITAENIHEKFILIASKDGELQYDVVDSFISETEKLLDWFRRQTVKRFIASSLFYVNGKNGKCQVKYIDFAHAIDSESLHDDNVIEGIENVLSTWRKVKETTK